MSIPKLKQIDEGDEYYHVRFRQPYRFDKVRIPNWAERVAQSISKDSKVKMGRTKAGNWFPQTVMIARPYRNKSDARRLSRKIMKKLENEVL